MGAIDAIDLIALAFGEVGVVLFGHAGMINAIWRSYVRYLCRSALTAASGRLTLKLC
jgi:hypothetical protein